MHFNAKLLASTARHSTALGVEGGDTRVPPRLSAITRLGNKDAVGRYTYTYTHAQRERATGDTRPNTATGVTLVQTYQPTHIC